MSHMNFRITIPLICIAMIALAAFTGFGLANADDANVSKAVFFVG